MAHNVFLYFPDPHCVLCRNGLPYHSSISSLRRNALWWEKEVVGFFDLSRNPCQGPMIFTRKSTLDRNRPLFIEPTFTIQHEGIQKTVNVVRERPSVRYRPLFFVHQLCCRIVESLPGNVSYRELYELAMQSHDILPKDCWDEEPLSHIISFPGTIESGIVDTENTSLGSCLLRCSTLPLELQNYILTHLHGSRDTAIFSLMTALQTLTLGRLHALAEIPNHPRFRKLLPTDHAEVVHVSASLVTLFGRSYIRAIEIFNSQDHRDTLGQECIEVRINSVRRMEFILGMYGIAAVRFYLDDHSVSPWLGDARKGWRCKPIDVARSDLSFPFKGQRGVVICFGKLLARASEDAPLNVLWDGSSRPLDNGVSFIAQYYTELHNMRPSPFPGRPMCKYLPLHPDGQHATGITVYLFDLGTSCIVVHGRTTHHQVSVRERKGVSWTFHFKEGEEIVTLGLVTTGYSGRRCGPFLLFETSLHRTAYFGPAVSQREATAEWVSLIPDHLDKKCAVEGLIVDQMAISFDCFRTIGARCMPRESATINHTAPASSSWLQLVLPANPRILRRTPFKAFAAVTRAHLYDIKQLRVLTKEARNWDNYPMKRFSGLWILHGNGSVETIGCWDDSLTKDAKVIYDEADGRLTRIIFRSKQGRNMYCQHDIVPFVAEITTRVIPHGSDQEDRNEEPNDYNEMGDYIAFFKIAWEKRIVWTFTETSDNVQNAYRDTKTYSVRPHSECKLLQIEQ